MFGWLLRHHTIMSFSLYTAGFVLFVLTLKKGMYTYQFGQYAWTHMILMVRGGSWAAAGEEDWGRKVISLRHGSRGNGRL